MLSYRTVVLGRRLHEATSKCLRLHWDRERSRRTTTDGRMTPRSWLEEQSLRVEHEFYATDALEVRRAYESRYSTDALVVNLISDWILFGHDLHSQSRKSRTLPFLSLVARGSQRISGVIFFFDDCFSLVCSSCDLSAKRSQRCLLLPTPQICSVSWSWTP